MTALIHRRLPVFATIGEAWERTRGSKLTIWGALILFALIMIALTIIKIITTYLFPSADSVTTAIMNVVYFLLHMGMLYIGIKRAQNVTITSTLIFQPFKFSLASRILVLYILQIVVFIPFIIILMIPTILNATIDFPGFFSKSLVYGFFYFIGSIGIIYIAVRMVLAMAFVLDQLTNPWQAIKLSFQATQKNFWRLIGIYIVMFFIFIISIIPLGIGLIWTFPFCYILYGVIYNNLLVNLRS